MVNRHPLQHSLGVEIHFPVANVALMLSSRKAGEDLVVIAYAAVNHSSSVSSPSMNLQQDLVSLESLLAL